MKILYCRDDDGTPTCWDKEAIEVLNKTNGIWESQSFAKQLLLAEGTKEVEDKFGPGFHGVKKGRIKLLDL